MTFLLAFGLPFASTAQPVSKLELHKKHFPGPKKGPGGTGATLGPWRQLQLRRARLQLTRKWQRFLSLGALASTCCASTFPGEKSKGWGSARREEGRSQPGFTEGYWAQPCLTILALGCPETLQERQGCLGQPSPGNQAHSVLLGSHCYHQLLLLLTPEALLDTEAQSLPCLVRTDPKGFCLWQEGGILGRESWGALSFLGRGCICAETSKQRLRAHLAEIICVCGVWGWRG